mmetsp:Transcript_18978/g.53043  ORF Transcript_18978/g.53043 Transcript_18978/m.53043 type:complete len:759 (-) Transcript_18978:160-2436(-)|eukprot:CAMPEP_0177164648 /NCGR_PEP_ID=MMETSP0367-20130122/7060_1 /TAXON_ID=447022 ORGANISM="Scrippsiella hangoei-like, Strain SHHI-4" /NCGR_SAMPLE_ID=MMETSP0367 /ASSEMBLY_ACC=CAM_ASM_000362 /LENGTH=758 /DNA_ID=CAMNT_0018610559 /DNA_START=20 /DNA_END=2296 /DNA_ORIENTATION=+
MALEQDYDIVASLGEGAFGKVYKAQHKASGDLVAVKQIKLGSKSWDEALKSTELAALRALRHNFIVRLRELLRSPKDGSLYYVFDFISSDLFKLMGRHPQGLEENHAAELQRQIFAGLAHTHQNNFFHRDIKPENILYDESTDTVRIADYGEARSVRARPPFTDYVGTRWYRAPECLLRDRTYSSPVDVWACGLVFCEMLRGTAMFCGTSSIDQLYKIFVVLGQPLTDWPEFTRLADACRFRVPDRPGCGLDRVLPRASPGAIGLASDVLRLNPRRRSLARKCLEHSYFTKLPALDLGRAEVFRGRSASSVACGEEQIETWRSEVSHLVPPPSEPSSANQDADGSRASGHSQPATPPDTSRQEDERPRKPSKSLSFDSDDLDLDAELDEILGASTPPGQPEISDFGILRAAAPHSLPRTASAEPGQSAHAEAVHRHFRPAGLETSWSAGGPVEEPPLSPGGGSVDALFEHLCADLGVAPDLCLPPDVKGDRGSKPGVFGSPLEITRLRAGTSGLPARGLVGLVSNVGVSGNGRRPAGRSEDSGPEDYEAEDVRSPTRRPTAELPRSSTLAASTGQPNATDAWSLSMSNFELAQTVSGKVAGVEMELPRAEFPCAPSLPTSPGSGQLRMSETGASWLSQATSRRPASAVVTGRAPSAGQGRHGIAGSFMAAGATLAQAHPDEDVEDLRKTSSTTWSVEESTQLRRIVKKIVKRGAFEKDALWAEVSRELAGARGPAECKKQYARDYKAHKAGNGGSGAA